jgi:hypothetical protein
MGNYNVANPATGVNPPSHSPCKHGILNYLLQLVKILFLIPPFIFTFFLP